MTMGLPTLLRRLWQAASSQDKRSADELIAEIRGGGWGDEIAPFIARLPSRDGTFLAHRANGTEPAIPRFGRGAGALPTQALAPQNPFAGVTKDATSNIYVPATSSEWTTFLAAAGLSISVPNALWLCQESSGDLADSIGSLTLTAAGTPGYAAAVAGWTRKGVTCSTNDTDAFAAAAGVGPDPSATSVCWLALVDVTAAPSAARRILTIGGLLAATEMSMSVTSASLPQFKRLTATTNGAVDQVAKGVIPVVIKYDRTNSTNSGYTDDEKLSIAYSSLVTDGVKGIGAATGANSAQSSYVYVCEWNGSAAEMSDANLKLLLQAMGFTIGWS